MFFFIAGVQPKAVTLDDETVTCPSCGLLRARRKRWDHYLSFFFIPLFRVKKGPVVLECPACGTFDAISPDVQGAPQTAPISSCPGCGSALNPSFRFCPYCGRRL